MKVRATKRGFYKRLYEPGETFSIPSRDALGSWMEPVKPGRPPKKPEDKPQDHDDAEPEGD